MVGLGIGQQLSDRQRFGGQGGGWACQQHHGREEADPHPVHDTILEVRRSVLVIWTTGFYHSHHPLSSDFPGEGRPAIIGPVVMSTGQARKMRPHCYYITHL